MADLQHVDMPGLEETIATVYDDEVMRLVVTRGVMACLCRVLESTIGETGDLVPWQPSAAIMLSVAYNGAAGMAWEVLKHWPGNPLGIDLSTPLHEVERMVLASIGIEVSDGS